MKNPVSTISSGENLQSLVLVQFSDHGLPLGLALIWPWLLGPFMHACMRMHAHACKHAYMQACAPCMHACLRNLIAPENRSEHRVTWPDVEICPDCELSKVRITLILQTVKEMTRQPACIVKKHNNEISKHRKRNRSGAFHKSVLLNLELGSDQTNVPKTFCFVWNYDLSKQQFQNCLFLVDILPSNPKHPKS